jgi:hypothetical protein
MVLLLCAIGVGIWGLLAGDTAKALIAVASIVAAASVMVYRFTTGRADKAKVEEGVKRKFVGAMARLMTISLLTSLGCLILAVVF